MTSNVEYVWGIDPGETGAIVLVRGKKVCFKSKLPKDENGLLTIDILDNVLDTENLLSVSDTVYLEHVHAIPGIAANSNWRLAQSFSALYMWCCSNFKHVHLFRPKAWQKIVIEEEDIVLKPTKTKSGRDRKDTKLSARKAAKRIFRHYDFVDRDKTPRGTKPDHNYVDAALITQVHYL